ncbi:MAG: hypothetical protein ACPGSO_05995 [Vicingaceae bacterium]
MECLLSGNTTLSLSEFDDCNKKPVNDCTISEKCCCFHEMSFDFDFDSNLKIKSFKIINAPVISSVVNNNNLITYEQNSSYHYTNLPPPGGTELLKKVQVFRL